MKKQIKPNTKNRQKKSSSKSFNFISRLNKPGVAIIIIIVVVFGLIGIFILFQSRAGAPRDITQQPFSRWSPFNMPIGSGANFGSNLPDRDININSSCWSISVYQANSTDDNVTINVENEDGDSPIIKAPINAVGTNCGSDYDRAISIVQPDGKTAAEMYRFFRHETNGIPDSYGTSDTFHLTDLAGTGIMQDWLRASGASYLGGLIRISDLDKGEINHALAMAILEGDLSQGPIWPADREDGNANLTYGNGGIKMGTLYALPPEINIDSLGLSTEGKMLARALQNYGAYVLDRAEKNVLYAEPDAESRIASMRSQWNKLNGLLRQVTNNAPSSVGGGGNPRVCYASPVGNDNAIGNPNPGAVEPTNCGSGSTPTIPPTTTVKPTTPPTTTVKPTTPPTTTVTPTTPPVGSQPPTGNPTPTSTNNIARGKNTIKSSELPGSPSSKVVDGVILNHPNRWLSADPSTTQIDNGTQYVGVDLGTNYNVTNIKVTFDTDTTASYNLQSSTDGKSWTTIWQNAAVMFSDNPVKTVTYSFNSLNTPNMRYVRVVPLTRFAPSKANGYPHSVEEIEVYGSTPSTPTAPPTTTVKPTNPPTPSTPPPPTADTTKPTGPAWQGMSLGFDWLAGRYYMNISWPAASDNVGVTSYEVRRNGVVIGNTASRSLDDRNIQVDQPYSYQVFAIDAAGNKSSGSTAKTTTVRCFWIFCSLQ